MNRQKLEAKLQKRIGMKCFDKRTGKKGIITGSVIEKDAKTLIVHYLVKLEGQEEYLTRIPEAYTVILKEN